MNQFEIIYNKEKQTHNLFLNGEWYAEGNYEYIEKMVENIHECENEEDAWDE